MDEFRSAPPHPAGNAQAASAGSAVPSGGPLLSHETLRSNLADFALAELVRQHRTSFPPPWTIESWAKLLIWLALNSGCAGDTASLEAFAASLGPERSGRLRRLFFSREFEAVGLDLQADPAEAVALLRVPPGGRLPDPEGIAALLEQVGLAPLLVLDRGRWQERAGGLVIPFA